MREPVGIPFGSYQLLRRLARGGMAEVFLARQVGLEGFDRLCALKRVLPHLVDSGEFVRMFLDEARLAAQLSHPNVVHIYEFGKVDEHYFIAMEWVDGVHAGQLIKKAETERLPDVLVARIGADACSGLHYAHEMRDGSGRSLHLVHRDVSPANLIVSFDGSVKLVDFGIAKAVSCVEETRPGVVKGKFAYMSPEQTIGKKLDGRSDVFSLSIVLWELLAGRVMVPREDPVEGMRMIRDDRIPRIEEIRPDVPPALAAALAHGLANDREERATALELGMALESYIKSAEGIGSSLAVASYIRSSFVREPASSREPALGGAPGTRPATQATRGLPAADDVGGTAVSGAAPGLRSALLVPPTPPAAASAIERVPFAMPMAAVEMEAAATVAGLTDVLTPTSSKWLPVGQGGDSVIIDHSLDAAATPDEVTRATGLSRRIATEEVATPQRFRPGSHGGSPRGPVLASPTATVTSATATGTATGATATGTVTATGGMPFAAETMVDLGPPDTAPFARFPGPGGTGSGHDTVYEQDSTFPETIGGGATALIEALPTRFDPAVRHEAGIPAPRNTTLWIVAGLAATLLATLGWVVVSSAGGDDGAGEAAAAPVEPVEPAAAPVLEPAAPAPVVAPKLEVVSRPPGAAVLIKPGDRAAVAPARFDDLEPGSYVVEVTLAGHLPLTHQVQLEAGEHRTLDLPLQPEPVVEPTPTPPVRPTGGDRPRDRDRPRPRDRDRDRPRDKVASTAPGSLTVRTRPYSEVYLGRRRLGQTPLAGVALAPGEYVLTFKNPERKTQTRRVVIKPGEVTKLDFALP